MTHDRTSATFEIAYIRFLQRSIPSDSKEFTELQIKILELQDQLVNWHN